MAVTQLGLYIIDKAQRDLLGPFVGLLTLSCCGIHHIIIIVIPLNGPVDHVFSTGQTTIGNHLVDRPHASRLAGLRATVVNGRASIVCCIIVLGPRDGGIVAHVLQDGDIGHVLNDGQCLLGSHVLACDRPCLQPHVIGHPHHAGHIAQLGGINHNLAIECLQARWSGQCRLPQLSITPQCCQSALVADGDERLVPDHDFENRITHMRLEHHLTHPPCLQGFERAIMLHQRITKLAPQSGRQPIVAVDGTHPSLCEHAAQPGGRLDQCHRHPHACALQGSGHATGAPTHHQHIGGTSHQRAAYQQQQAHHTRQQAHWRPSWGYGG